MTKPIVGGGAKKILYTLQTAQRIGLINSAKALRSKNTCKACAYGMGGQRGGMTNELGEFPSFCNKSVQAQSTDIQPAIPEAVFDHSLEEFRALGPARLEKMGRLGVPIFKAAGKEGSEQKYQPISWDAALNMAAERLGETDPARSFFYASGRSSNEAGFIFQLLARSYGTNNVSNCSYYCHQATGVGLSSSIGTGTATIELEDLKGADLIFVIGANPSSNHPRFIHMLAASRDRGGDVVIINPAKESGLVKFAVPKSPKSLLSGGTDIASLYLQPKIGSDLALLKGLAKAVIEQGAQDDDFIVDYCDGYRPFADEVGRLSWDEIETRTGLPRADIEHLASLYGRAKNAVFAWGMGVTHHENGCENVEHISNLALLRGQIGRPYAGLLPLRGHSNVQGVGTIGVKPVLADEVMRAMQERLGAVFPAQRGLDTMAAMQAAANGDMDACVLLGGNLLAANPDTQWARATMNKIGFRLCLTTTLNQSHFDGVEGACLILPVAARDEEWQPTTQESMFNFVRMSDGGIERLAGVRPESDILCDLALRLLPDAPIDFKAFKSHKTIREAIAVTVPGMDGLSDIDVAKQEFHIKGRLLHAPDFKTPNGKAQFRCAELAPTQGLGEKVETEKGAAQFMLASVRSEGQFNSIIYEQSDSYRGTQDRWTVMMHPDDIAALGAQSGDKVDISSEQGEMRGVALHAYDMARGSVLAYYPEANILTSNAVDPRSRTPAFKAVMVQIKANDAAQ